MFPGPHGKLHGVSCQPAEPLALDLQAGVRAGHAIQREQHPGN